MQRVKFTLMVLIAVGVLGGATAIKAQLPHGPVLRAQIPYSFTVGNQTFAPGEYTFARAGQSSPATTLLIRGTNGESALFDTIRHNSVDGYSETELVFERVNGRHFLSKIKLEGQFTGYEIRPSKSQRQLYGRTNRIDKIVLRSYAIR
jgi:hypothetical protein